MFTVKGTTDSQKFKFILLELLQNLNDGEKLEGILNKNILPKSKAYDEDSITKDIDVGVKNIASLIKLLCENKVDKEVLERIYIRQNKDSFSLKDDEKNAIRSILSKETPLYKKYHPITSDANKSNSEKELLKDLNISNEDSVNVEVKTALDKLSLEKILKNQTFSDDDKENKIKASQAVEFLLKDDLIYNLKFPEIDLLVTFTKNCLDMIDSNSTDESAPKINSQDIIEELLKSTELYKALNSEKVNKSAIQPSKYDYLTLKRLLPKIESEKDETIINLLLKDNLIYKLNIFDAEVLVQFISYLTTKNNDYLNYKTSKICNMFHENVDIYDILSKETDFYKAINSKQAPKIGDIKPTTLNILALQKTLEAAYSDSKNPISNFNELAEQLIKSKVIAALEPHHFSKNTLQLLISYAKNKLCNKDYEIPESRTQLLDLARETSLYKAIINNEKQLNPTVKRTNLDALAIEAAIEDKFPTLNEKYDKNSNPQNKLISIKEVLKCISNLLVSSEFIYKYRVYSADWIYAALGNDLDQIEDTFGDRNDDKEILNILKGNLEDYNNSLNRFDELLNLPERAFLTGSKSNSSSLMTLNKHMEDLFCAFDVIKNLPKANNYYQIPRSHEQNLLFYLKRDFNFDQHHTWQEKELKEHINTQFESRNLNPAYLIKYRYMLNDKLNVSYSNHVEQLKLYYDQLHLTDFVASVFFAFLGTLANIGFLTHIISSTVASYILIPTVILSFVYGSVIIAKKHAHNERLYSLNTAMNALNIGYLFLSAASVAITSIYLQTSLMPLSIISCFISLGASYIHRFTTFNAVIPKEVEPLVDKDMLTYVGEKNSKICSLFKYDHDKKIVNICTHLGHE